MKTLVDIQYLNDVLLQHYKSKSEMAKSIGITRSHLQEVFKNKGIGQKFLTGLKKESKNKGFNFELCLKPPPILLADKEVESISITNKEGTLLASISSRDIISEEGTNVIVIPYDN